MGGCVRGVSRPRNRRPSPSRTPRTATSAQALQRQVGNRGVGGLLGRRAAARPGGTRPANGLFGFQRGLMVASRSQFGLPA